MQLKLPEWPVAREVTAATDSVAIAAFVVLFLVSPSLKTVNDKRQLWLFFVRISKFKTIKKIKKPKSKISSHMSWTYNTPLSHDSDTTR